MSHVEVIEGFEVAIAALVEKMSICEFYSSIYNGVPLLSLSATNNLHLQSMLDSALPELYAAVIVFSVKARTYFEAKGMYTLYARESVIKYLYSTKFRDKKTCQYVKVIRSGISAFH